MRVLLAFSLISLTIATDKAINLPCNSELDGLLAVDPDGNPSAFLSCQGVGAGQIGFWERKMCPHEMIFDFINQRCKAVTRMVHRKPQTNLNIAILNSSCAKGETCIGGTVCDRERMRCLCPYGTIPQLETLSCIKNENAFSPERFKFSFENTNTGTGFLPNPSQNLPQSNNGPASFMPNPNFNKFNSNSNYATNINNNNNNNNNFGNAPWTSNGQPASSSPNTFVDMMPNHKFVFGNFGTTQAPTTKAVPRFAEPGQSCRSNEICMGGSLCTFPIGLCLCPGDLESRGGECVLPASSSIKIQKVGIGAICNDLAECDDGSVCQMGRCACVSPLVEFEGKCVLRQERKEVGPGDLCDNGEICSRGSICDKIIPVCVCPSETDLFEGECVRVFNSKPSGYLPPTQASSIASQAPYVHQTTTQKPVPVQTPSTKTIPPIYTFNQNIVQQPTTYNYKAVTNQQVTSKPNHMKIALGGSKQAGVGVRCSLNTDCMIGAYCNGNTSPPSCQCLSTHVNVEGRCEKVIYPGQIGCRSSLQCSTAYAGTSCVDRVCQCPEGTKTVDQTCIPEPDECFPTCQPPLTCSHSTCICPDGTNCSTELITFGHLVSSDDDESLRKTPKIIQTIKLRQRRQSSKLECSPGAESCSDGHGICINSKCHCLNGLVARDGFCRPLILPVNSSCDSENLSAVCEAGAICIDGFCNCQYPGGCDNSNVVMCENHAQCPQTFVCVTGRCVCNRNYELKNGQCQLRGPIANSVYKSINNSCDVRVDRCSGGSICLNDVCQCVNGATENSARCHQVPQGRCVHGELCVNGSICELGRCRCQDGLTISTRNPTVCVVISSEPGKSCHFGERCINGSVCRFGTCMCESKRVNVNGRCVKKDSIPGKLKKAKPGSFGSTVSPVKLPSTPAPSTETELDPIPATEPGTIRNPGEKCSLLDICNGGSLCQDHMCKCQEHDIIIDNKCVGSQAEAILLTSEKTVAAPGQACDTRTTCTGGSVCIDALCRCETGIVNSQGNCQNVSDVSTTTSESPDSLMLHTPTRQKAKKESKEDGFPGMECILTMQCPFRTECLQGVCRCRQGETIVEGTCRQSIHQVRVGGACNPQKGYDCVGESFCISGACVCQHKMRPLDGLCVPDSQFNQVLPTKKCGADSICMGGSTCVENVCRCEKDYVPDVNDKCVKKSSVYPVLKLTTPPPISTTTISTTTGLPKLGEACSYYCSDGLCRNGICVDIVIEMEKVELELKQNPAKSAIADEVMNTRSSTDELMLVGTHCYQDSDCPTASHCLQGICYCTAGYRATAGYCEPIVPLGSSCVSTNQCPVHSVCVQGTCQCAASLRDGKACKPPRLGRPGDACLDGVICSYNSYCGLMSSVCECPSGMSTQKGECRQTAAATGQSCVTSRNCHRFSYCDNGLCLCKTGFELVNDFCMPPAKKLSLNEVEDLMHNGLENERNDGPQAPMQERIRTETFLRSMMNNQENFVGPVNSPTPMLAQGVQVTAPVVPTMTAMNPTIAPRVAAATPSSQTMQLPHMIPPATPTFSAFSPVGSSTLGMSGFNSQSSLLNTEPRLSTSTAVVNPFIGNTMTQSGFPQTSSGPLPIDLMKPPFNYAMPPNYQVIYPTGAPNQLFQTPGFGSSAALGNYFRDRFSSFPIVSGASTVSGDSRSFDSNSTNTKAMGSFTPQKLRFAMPGEYCGDKVICLGNSFCTNDFCRCPEHCSAQNGICAYKVQAAVQPHRDASHSSRFEDEDEDRQYLNSTEERQFAQPLENCQNFEFCVGGSECLAIAAKLGLMCQCPVGTIYFQDECIEAPKGIGLIGIGETCGKNEICLGGSICTEEKCICRGGRRDVLGICVFTAHPGDDCSQGQLCVDGSVCAGQKRTCICPPGKRSLLGKCVEQDSPEDGFALNPKTDGEENSKEAVDRRKFSSVYPGENCNGSLSICMDNSRCSNKHICECLPRFFNVDGRCVPIDMVRKPSDSCTVTTICVTGARCIEDVCTCADGLLGVDDRCIPMSNNIRRQQPKKAITPGQNCELDEDCPLHFKCNDKLCICHGSSSECLSIMLLSVDAQCSDDMNCPLNSMCNEGICICVDGYRMEADRCVQRHLSSAFPLLNKLPMFASTSPMFASTLPNIPTTTVPTLTTKSLSTDNMVLNRIPSVSVPAMPHDPAMASRLLSSFLNALSQASEAMRFSDALITTTASGNELESNDVTPTITSFSVPGQPCELPNLICANNGICFKDYCVCSYEYVPIDDKCEPRDGNVPLGSACSETHRCSESFVCLNDVCSCPPNDSTCNPNEPVTSPPGGSCTDARECTGGSVCREGWCICPDPSMIVQKGICIQSGIRPTLPPKTVPVYTTSQPTAPVYQTQPSSAAPTSRPTPSVNTFNALPSSIHQGRKVTPGSQCGPLDSCVGGSMCLDGLCVCPAGTEASQNGRCEAVTTTVPTTRATTAWRTTRRPVDFIELPTHAPNIVDYNNQRNNNNIPEYTSLSSGYNGHNIERNYGRPSIVSSASSSSTAYYTTKSTTTSTTSSSPTTTTTTTTTSTSTLPATLAELFANKDECEAIGLYCRGNTICINKSCQCPDGHILHNDGCVPPSEAGKRKVRGKARHQATTNAVVFSKPGEDCANGQSCTGGSICNDEFDCACPADKPVLAHGICIAKTEDSKRQAVPGESCNENTECINGSSCHSGQCRCAPQFIALSGFCVQMPMSTTPQMKTIAKPLESCENGETCEGGSKCDDDTLMCMCPKGQVAFGPECKVPPGAAVSQVTTEEAISSNPSTTECENDNNCGDGKLCVAGRCRCRPGTVDNAGICELLEAIRPKHLKYGQPCDVYRDRCINAAKCIDSVCKCPPGLYLNTTGWCEYVDYTKLKTNNTSSSRVIRPFASTSPAINFIKEIKPTSPPFFASIGKGFGHKSDESDEVHFSRPIYERPYAPEVTTRRATIPTTSKTSTTTTTSTTSTTTTASTTSTTPITSTTTEKLTKTSTEEVSTAKKGVPRMRGRKPGSSCRDNDICMGGSSCTNGRCQCEENYIIKNGRCSKALLENISQPGNTCADGEQCTGGSICDSDTHLCICAARHIIVNGICKSKDGFTYVQPGSSCDYDIICSGGSQCVDGICQCDNNHYSEDGYCRHVTSRSSQIKHDAGGSLRFSSKAFQRRNIAGPCDMKSCRLPDCFCTPNGRRSPLPDSPIHDVPQFVVLTFDDAVNGRTLPDYKHIFENVTFKNPNGCPIKGTFFISHEWTNYDGVQWLSQKGMELASNSISHVSLAGESASRWLNEMDGQRRIMAKFSNSFEEEIVGMRAPQLSAGGDDHFEMMSRSGFIYDNTLSANPGVNGEPYWPQTLDHQIPWNCHEENCPTSSFPGIWEVPLNQFYGIYLNQIESYRRSSMVRAAVDLNNTVQDLTSMLLRNFNRAYNTNRAPFVLSLNADYLQLNGKNTGMKSLNQFLGEVMQNKDVFVVTIKQLIDWMKNPLPMTQIHRSEAVRCTSSVQFSQTPDGTRASTCTRPNKCMYRTPTLNSQEHQFLTCSPCPEHYPWLENPIGTSSLVI